MQGSCGRGGGGDISVVSPGGRVWSGKLEFFFAKLWFHSDQPMLVTHGWFWAIRTWFFSISNTENVSGITVSLVKHFWLSSIQRLVLCLKFFFADIFLLLCPFFPAARRRLRGARWSTGHPWAIGQRYKGLLLHRVCSPCSCKIQRRVGAWTMYEFSLQILFVDRQMHWLCSHFHVPLWCCWHCLADRRVNRRSIGRHRYWYAWFYIPLLSHRVFLSA